LLDGELVLWVEQQIELLEINNPYSTYFSKYLKEHWLQKQGCGASKIKTSPMQGKTPTQLWNHFTPT
jgi:hypothetical protein